MIDLIRNVIAKELGVNEKDITPKSNLLDEFGMDSMDIYNLKDSLHAVGVCVDEEIEIETVQDIIDAVNTNK